MQFCDKKAKTILLIYVYICCCAEGFFGCLQWLLVLFISGGGVHLGEAVVVWGWLLCCCCWHEEGGGEEGEVVGTIPWAEFSRADRLWSPVTTEECHVFNMFIASPNFILQIHMRRLRNKLLIHKNTKVCQWQLIQI